jgi:hypothetical protein
MTQLLALETAGKPATSETLVAAVGRLLDTLSQRLADVIGPAGVQSILRRAVKLAKSEFTFLDERIVPAESRDGLAEPLRAALQEYEPDVIRQVSVTLFATFLGLLAKVIGDRLTWSLLQQSWPDILLARTDREETEE